MVVGTRTVVFIESTVRRSKSGRRCLTQRRAYVSCFIYGKTVRTAQQQSRGWRVASVGWEVFAGGGAGLLFALSCSGVASSSTRDVRRVSGGRQG